MWFVFRDSPPALHVTTYLTEARLYDIRTFLKVFQLPEDTVVFTLHLKAASRTFPSVIFDGESAIARQLLSIGDDA